MSDVIAFQDLAMMANRTRNGSGIYDWMVPKSSELGAGGSLRKMIDFIVPTCGCSHSNGRLGLGLAVAATLTADRCCARQQLHELAVLLCRYRGLWCGDAAMHDGGAARSADLRKCDTRGAGGALQEGVRCP